MSPTRPITPTLRFEIRHDDGDLYRVELSDLATQGRASDAVAISASEVEGWCAGSRQAPDAVGAALAARLLTPKLVGFFREQRGRSPAGAVRIEFCMPEPENPLHALPWELIHGPAGDGAAFPLAIGEATPFVRFDALEQGVAEPLPTWPLRLLVVVANPWDLRDAGMDAVEVVPLLRDLLAGLAAHARAGRVAVTLLSGVSDLPDDLASELRGAGWYLATGAASLDNLQRLAEACDLLCLTAHGRADGVLLETDTGAIAATPAASLVDRVGSAGHKPHLVFFAACFSGQRAGGDAFAALGPSLHAAGVPAVVAMQDAVAMDAARRLAADFFDALLDPARAGGQVDLALNRARRLLYDRAQPVWAPPVLFCRLRDGRLYTAPVADGSPQADPRVATVVQNQYNYGATPEQFADMLTRLFGLMVEIPQARHRLTNARTLLENARRQLRRLAEYKEAHDLLQQLELSYLVIYSLIYDAGELLAPAQVRWRSLERSRDDLQSSIQRVCNMIGAASFASDVTECREELAHAAGDMQDAFAGRDLALLDVLLADVQRVIGTQTPRMNDRLIAAVDGLQLAVVAQRLAALHGDVLQARGALEKGQAEQLATLTGDVAGLVQLAGRLHQLRNAHDRWQQADNELRTEQATLSTAARRFPSRWQRTLGQRLRDLCAPAADEQERTLALHIAAVDAALAPLDPVALADAVDDCRRAVSRRLNQIDHDLRTLCTLLKEAGGPLDTLLERLV